MSKHKNMSFIYLLACVVIICIEVVMGEAVLTNAFWACFLASTIWSATDK